MFNDFKTTNLQVGDMLYYIERMKPGNIFKVGLPRKTYMILYVAGRGNGSLYFKIISVDDQRLSRNYVAQRYMKKYIALAREIAFALRQVSAVWDYTDDKLLEPVK